MKIRSVSIQSFGKLKDRDFTFSDGINIITGENESGKSTLARFVRFMLYGYTSPRSSSLTENDKKRYSPWDGAPSHGEMTVCADDGSSYTLLRDQGTRASFSAMDGAGVPVFKGIPAGEALLGLSADTFDKTAFIGSGDVLFDDAAALSGAIKNMVFSADSAVDSEAALKRLETFRRSILGKTERTGKLAEAREEFAVLKAREQGLREVHRELLGADAALARVRENLEENRAHMAALEKEKANAEAYRAYVLLEKIENAEKEQAKAREESERVHLAVDFDGFVPDRAYLTEMNRAVLTLAASKDAAEAAKKDLADAEETLRASFSDLRQMKFNDLLEQTGKTSEEILRSLEALRKRYKTLKRLTILFACLIVTLPIALFTGLRAARLKKELEKLASSFGCVSLEELEKYLVGYTASSALVAQAKKRRDEAQGAVERTETRRGADASALSDMLDRTGCGLSYSDTSALCETATEHIRSLDAALAKAERAERTLADCMAVYEGLCAHAPEREALKNKAACYDKTLPLREEEKLLREFDFYKRAGEGLSVRERELEKKAAVLVGSMEKPDELAAKLAQLEKDIAHMEKEHAALGLACEALEKAHEEMRGNVSPILTRGASELFERLTDGKYTGLYVDNELSLSFLEKNSAEYRSAEYLSAGALDAAYLALRLTLAEYLYKEKPVFLFDDAFVHLDDVRFGRVCELLRTLAERYQILLFTCGRREENSLGGNIIHM